MKTLDIAILVSEKFNKNQAFRDDLILQEALQNCGHRGEIVVWDDPAVDFNQYDLAIIRSCWDYDTRLEEFLSKMEVISHQLLLVNSYDLVKWNSDKSYLLELAQRGIAVIPSQIIHSLSEVSIPCHWQQVVVKPTVSASGKDTSRYFSYELDSIRKACQALLDKHKVPILQKYIASVETKGELSSVVIDSKITHTMVKTPAEGNFLVHDHYGGTSLVKLIGQGEEDYIRGILAKLDQIPLYMRIDYLPNPEGGFFLLELEEIEPGLYLSENKESPRLLAKAIIDRYEKWEG